VRIWGHIGRQLLYQFDYLLALSRPENYPPGRFVTAFSWQARVQSPKTGRGENLHYNLAIHVVDLALG